MVVPPTSPYSNMLIGVDDYQWKEWRRKYTMKLHLMPKICYGPLSALRSFTPSGLPHPVQASQPEWAG